MSTPEKTVVITGVAGNLGVRLLREITDFDVLGLDMYPIPAERLPNPCPPLQFESMDVGEESSCSELVNLLRRTRAQSVVHLAFVIDPVRTGVLDVSRMWRINVAGTARVMEAISIVNRTGGLVNKFIFISSVSGYGPDLPGPVTEDYPLGAHTLPYAIHKRESDEVVQARADSLGTCRTYILRPHIFAGASMQNYLVNILRGTPYGRGWLGRYLEKRGTKLPALIPYGQKYLNTKFQYVHVDDMARLLAWLLRRREVGSGTTILNVAGRGDPITFRRCAEIAGSRIKRLPGTAACRMILNLGWKLGISCVPAAAVPYFTGTYLMDTTRLQQLLGKEYRDIIRHTCEEALADSFRQETSGRPAAVEQVTT